ncbi:MAG: hypothetical protein ACE5OS_08590 [Anaerolineae bacterium]
MTDSQTAQERIADLIARYEALSPARRSALSEMDTRHIFILPLFDALGWDITSNPDEVAEEAALDALVYELYGLTEEESALVEERG